MNATDPMNPLNPFGPVCQMNCLLPGSPGYERAHATGHDAGGSAGRHDSDHIALVVGVNVVGMILLVAVVIAILRLLRKRD